MKTQVVFGKQVGYGPWWHTLILTVLAFGISLVFFSLWTSLVVALIVLGVVFFGYYPYYFAQLFGAWQLTDQELSCYSATSYGEKVRLLLHPESQLTTRPLSEVQHVQFFKRLDVKDSSDILAISQTGYAPELYLPWMRKPNYARVTFNDGQTVVLDFSWNIANKTDLPALKASVHELAAMAKPVPSASHGAPSAT